MVKRSVPVGLIRLFRELKGELIDLERPPKRRLRLIPQREKYEAETPARLQRIAAIRADFAHIEHVARLFDPEWD